MPDEAAPAKVNLFLQITGRQADGYHTLDSLVVFADIADRLGATLAPKLRLSIDGPFAADLPSGDENLVLRAARVLAATAGVTAGAALRLTKVLPHAAGLGGGSADAAATFRLLERLWRCPPGSIRLLALAARVGADVPVCLESRPVRVGGIGEVLDRAPALPSFGLCLVNPGCPLLTKTVFAARNGPFSGRAELPSAWHDVSGLAARLAELRNDLEAPAIALCPPIATVLQALAATPRCLLARMSGSGATCFGLFPDATTAQQAAQQLARPGWWCWGGGLARLPP